MQQPPGNQPPPYGNQPAGNQPQYGDQPPANQPPQYGDQPPQYGSQPPSYENQQPYGNQPPFGNQPPPYGQPPSGMPQLAVVPQEENDKIIAAASYVFWILLGAIILLTDMKNKPFLKFHAYQSITFGLVLLVGWIIAGVLSVVVVGLCLMPILFLASLYPAYLAYTKGTFRLPLITDLTYNIFKDTPQIP